MRHSEFYKPDWTVFEAAANNLDKLTKTVTSYIVYFGLNTVSAH